MKQKLIVIGNGMAGMKVVEELLDAAPEQYDITVFGAEPHGNYNRILLSQVLSGEKNIDEIMINDEAWYKRHNIRLFVGAEKAIKYIDRKNKRVSTVDGQSLQYDRLLIATGSKPFIVPIDGRSLKGVIAFRDIADVETMLHYSQTKQHAVVLGGGLLGLEAANGLIEQGMQVTVVHRSEFILNRQLDKESASLLQKELEDRGVNFILSAKLKRLVGQHTAVAYAEFEDGSTIPCDLVVMAIGVTPNIELARSAGLSCGKGIKVDDTLQTFDPSIYAVGECIEHRGNTFGLVAPLFEQAKVCANHLASHGAGSYVTLAQATKLKITGVFVFSAGNFNGTQKSEDIIFRNKASNTYKKLIVENNILIGAVLYGETKDGLWYQSLIEKRENIQAFRTLLIFGQHYCEPVIEAHKELTKNAAGDLDMASAFAAKSDAQRGAIQ